MFLKSSSDRAHNTAIGTVCPPKTGIWSAARHLPCPNCEKPGIEIPLNPFASQPMLTGMYVDKTGIGERIELEINRKAWDDLRWEEMWDVFFEDPQPVCQNAGFGPDSGGVVHNRWQTPSAPGRPSVRSSAPDEDSAEASFAGLHESYLNVVGLEQIVHHVRLVWASLWSDRALLYRRKLGLDVRRSAMAVLVQKMVYGRASGIALQPESAG